MELITADQIVQTPLSADLGRLRQAVWRAMPEGVSRASGGWVLRGLWESELRPLLPGRIDLGAVLQATSGAPPRMTDIHTHILTDGVLAQALVELETQGTPEALVELLRRTTTGYSPLQTVQCAYAVLVLGVANVLGVSLAPVVAR